MPTTRADLPTITADRHDSYWAIAERTLGSGLRWREIRDLNVGRSMDDGTVLTEASEEVHAGWRLVLPATAGVVEEPPPTREAQPTPGPTEVTVAEGDNLWAIAETHLTATFGRRVAAEETAPYWLQLIELNRSRLVDPDNPDLIYPGQTFALPETPGATPAPQPEPPPEEEVAVGAPASVEQMPGANAKEGATAPATTEKTARSTTTEPVERTEPSDAPSDRSGEHDDDRLADLVAKLGVGGALASLALWAVSRRRRSRRRLARPARHVRRLTDEDIETGRALSAASDGALTAAWRAADTFGTALGKHPDLPAVVGMVVKASGDVAFYLSQPVDPVEPFTEDDEAGRPAWLLTGDLIEQSDDTGTEVPVFETLVAVGTTEAGDHLLLDIETLGTVAIVGDETKATSLARSLAAQLALQPLNHYVNLTVLGIDTPQNAEQGVVRVDRLDEELIRRLERTTSETASALTEEGFHSTVAARANGIPRDGLVATVLATSSAADPVLLNRLAEAATPGGRAVGLITLGQIDSAAAHLVVTDDGDLYIPHLGLTARPAGLDQAGLNRLDTLLDHEPAQPSPPVHLVPTPQNDQNTAADPGPYEEPDWTYRVRVLADLQIEDRYGETLSFTYGDNPKVPNKSAHRGPEAIAYLALVPDRSATLNQLRDDLWWGRSIASRSADNMLSATRTVLGGKTFITYGAGPSDRRRYQSPRPSSAT